MQWYRRDYGSAVYSADQGRFAALHAALGLPTGMMMLMARNKVLDSFVYISLPSDQHLASFPGFAPSGPPTETDVFSLYHAHDDAKPFLRMRGRPI